MITRIGKRNLFFPSSYRFSFYEGSDFLPRQLHVAPATGVTCGFFQQTFFKNKQESPKGGFNWTAKRRFCLWGGGGPGGGGVHPYKGLMGRCGQPGYVQYLFRDFCLKQGIEFIIFCLNQGIDLSIFVLNRISFLGR